MNTYKLERNFNKKVPDWQTILENFNWSLLNKKFTKHISPGFFCIVRCTSYKRSKRIFRKT